MTSVKTTRVNIASVVPVRNRSFNGYAIDIRSTGARPRDRPNTRMTPASRRSALKTITQTVPMTIRRPATIQAEKSIARFPKTRSISRQGSSRKTTTASPQAVNASRSGTPARRRSGTRLMRTSENPSMRGVKLSLEAPRYTRASPRARPTSAPHQAASTAGHRRLGEVADRGRDRHDAHPPRRERDDEEREEQADRERDDEAAWRYRELDLEALVGVRSAERLRHHDHHSECDESPQHRSDGSGEQVVDRALEGEHLDEVAPTRPDGAGDPELATTLGGEHHEDEEDQQDPCRDRERAERREERDECSACFVGRLDGVLLHRLHLELSLGRDRAEERGDVV